ncbi:hypothetical protein HBI53_208680 [Parastagonospora nodorum]|nr:hypothetical protein HBI53_208680 [Parastagonospora nodorum]
MEDLEKEYGIKGRPLKLPLQRIAEDEEGGGFDLPPIPSHKNKFDSARSSAGPHFSSKAPHPGLRNLAKTMKCDPAASFSSEAGEESIEPESPSGKTSSTSRITTQSGGAGDEDSSEHMSALTESTSSVNTFVSVSSRIRDDNNCSSLISVASYHTAPTGPCFTQIGAEGVPVVASPSLSTAPCTSTNKSEVGRSKKIALATVQNNASNEQPAVEESIAIHSPKRDPEIASFKSAKAGTSNRYQPLLWVISWLTILVLLCTFIGKNHDPFAAPTLSGEKQDKTKRMVEANATSWVTFRHNATFAFSIQWPHNSILNVTASNATGSNTRSLVERDRVTSIAWRADSTETWNPMLYIEHSQPYYRLSATQRERCKRVINFRKLGEAFDFALYCNANDLESYRCFRAFKQTAANRVFR